MTWQKFLGLRQLWEERAIRELGNRATGHSVTGSLLLFETSKQRTWLVSTGHELVCILDDLRHPEPDIEWTMNREELVERDQLRIDISEQPFTDQSGKLNIGSSHRGWLFSRRLFGPDGSPVEAVGKLITKAMDEPIEAVAARA